MKSKLSVSSERVTFSLGSPTWLWTSQLPYDDYRLQYWGGDHYDRDFDHPSLMKGSRQVYKNTNRHRNLRERFCKKAAYALRLTTAYGFQTPHPDAEEIIMRINESACKRFPNARIGTLEFQTNHFHRFEQGREVCIYDVGEKQNKWYFDKFFAATKEPADKTHYRVEAAKELVAILEKIDKLESM